jgi:hypothetical protein
MAENQRAILHFYMETGMEIMNYRRDSLYIRGSYQQLRWWSLLVIGYRIQ